jgi:hypothetical protein
LLRQAAAVALVALAACSARPEPSSGGPAHAGAASATALARPPSARASDPRWIRAGGDEPIERIRLAEAVGAEELVDALDDGGAIEKTALSAIPFARDADLALAPLAARAAAAAAAPERTALLESLLAVAGRPRDQRDPIDPEGVRAAAATLVAIAGRASLPRDDRALAVSAARALADKGWIEAARIPTDLDPR